MHADNLCTRFWVEGLNDVVRNFPGKNSSVKIITRIPSRLEKLFFGIIYRFMLAYHVSHFADKKRMKEKPHCQSTSNNSHIFSPKHITYLYWIFDEPFSTFRDIYAHVVRRLLCSVFALLLKTKLPKKLFSFRLFLLLLLLFAVLIFADITEMFIQMTEHVLTHNAIDVIDFKSSHTEQREQKNSIE